MNPEPADPWNIVCLVILFGTSATILGWAVGYLFTLIWHHPKFRSWRTFRTECAWCDRRMHGNPFARSISHGMCRRCFALHEGEITKRMNN